MTRVICFLLSHSLAWRSHERYCLIRSIDKVENEAKLATLAPLLTSMPQMSHLRECAEALPGLYHSSVSKQLNSTENYWEIVSAIVERAYTESGELVSNCTYCGV